MVDMDSDLVLAPIEDTLEEGEVHVEEESEEDAPRLRLAPNVVSPSREKIEDHRICHYPYRSWCKQCVMGRGVGQPHAKSTQESLVPIVGMDYFYITKEGVRRRTELAKELEAALEKASAPAAEALRRGDELADDAISKARSNGEVVKCLLVRCLQGKNVFAHVVLQKGDDEDHYCAEIAVADIEWLGRTKLIIKTDNEPAIVQVLKVASKSPKVSMVDQAM